MRTGLSDHERKRKKCILIQKKEEGLQMTGKPMKCYLCGEEASLIREDLMSQVETINCPHCHLQYRVGDSFRDFYKGPLSHQKKLHLQNLIKSHPSILLEALHLQ